MVAATGSVSRAAERLHLTQPAITKQIRALEESLGVRLVERTGRGVRLTDAGEILADYGRRGSHLFHECRQTLEELDGGVRGVLRLGAGVTTCIFHLPAWLQRFRRDRPNIEITVSTGTSRAVAQRILDREIDLGFVTSPVSDTHLKTEHLFTEDIVLVVSPDLAVRRPASLEDIPLILFPSTTGFRQYLNDTLGSERIAQQVKMETDSVEAIKSFVMVGLGGSFLPVTSVAKELADHTLKRLRPASLPKLCRATTVVYRRDRKPGAAAREFLRVIGAKAPIGKG